MFQGCAMFEIRRFILIKKKKAWKCTWIDEYHNDFPNKLVQQNLGNFFFYVFQHTKFWSNLDQTKQFTTIYWSVSEITSNLVKRPYRFNYENRINESLSNIQDGNLQCWCETIISPCRTERLDGTCRSVIIPTDVYRILGFWVCDMWRR